MVQFSCFFKNSSAQPDQHRDGDQQRNERAVEAGKTQCLGERPARDRDVVGGRINISNDTTEAFERRNRVGQATKIPGRDQSKNCRREKRRHLCARHGRDEQPNPGGTGDVKACAAGRGQEKSPFIGTRKSVTASSASSRKLIMPSAT